VAYQNLSGLRNPSGAPSFHVIELSKLPRRMVTSISFSLRLRITALFDTTRNRRVAQQHNEPGYFSRVTTTNFDGMVFGTCGDRVSVEGPGRGTLLVDSKLHYLPRIECSRISGIEEVGIVFKTYNVFEGWVGAARVWTGGFEYKETSVDKMMHCYQVELLSFRLVLKCKSMGLTASLLSMERRKSLRLSLSTWFEAASLQRPWRACLSARSRFDLEAGWIDLARARHTSESEIELRYQARQNTLVR